MNFWVPHNHIFNNEYIWTLFNWSSSDVWIELWDVLVRCEAHISKMTSFCLHSGRHQIKPHKCLLEFLTVVKSCYYFPWGRGRVLKPAEWFDIGKNLAGSLETEFNHIPTHPPTPVSIHIRKWVLKRMVLPFLRAQEWKKLPGRNLSVSWKTVVARGLCAEKNKLRAEKSHPGYFPLL